MTKQCITAWSMRERERKRERKGEKYKESGTRWGREKEQKE